MGHENVVFHRGVNRLRREAREIIGAVHFVGNDPNARDSRAAANSSGLNVLQTAQVTQLTVRSGSTARGVARSSVSPQAGIAAVAERPDLRRPVFGDGSVSLGDVPIYRLMGRLARRTGKNVPRNCSPSAGPAGGRFCNVEVLVQGEASLARRAGNHPLARRGISTISRDDLPAKILSIRSRTIARSASATSIRDRRRSHYLTGSTSKADAISLEGAGGNGLQPQSEPDVRDRLDAATELAVLLELLGMRANQIVVNHVEGRPPILKIVPAAAAAMNRLIEQHNKGPTVPCRRGRKSLIFRAWEADRRTLRRH